MARTQVTAAQSRHMSTVRTEGHDVNEAWDVPAGEVISCPSDPDGSSYVIVHGWADAWSGERYLGVLGPGDVVGPLSALEVVRGATIVPWTSTRLRKLATTAPYGLTANGRA